MKIEKPARVTGISVPCTMDEKEDLSRRAIEKDMSVSAYVRWLIKNYPEKAKNRGDADEDDGK